jgi:DNA invertase Pin-like site-specific DNA recombinase
MKGQRIGYIRVSSADQNADRQLDNIELDRTFTDKTSGKNTDRPALTELLRYAREGDIVIVHSIDRLARNLEDLRHLVNDLTSRGVRIQFAKEDLIFTGDESPMSTLLLSVMGAFAEFERAIIKERQREGIEKAKKKGVYKGRKRVLTPLQAQELRSLAVPGCNKSALARRFGISRESVYRYLG